jgi:cobalt-zinc-cadmium efflux system protein
MVAEALGGWLTNSLALLSDAGHMLTDAAALGLSLLALRIGELPPSSTKTFGYRRFEVLAALFNGLTLWAIVGVIVHEAIQRILAPPAVQAWGMMLVASGGLAVNLWSIRLLHAHKDENINVRGAFLHVVADCLGSVGALGAGLVVALSGWTLADPLVSLGICALILWSSWGLVRDSVHVLLLGVPTHLDYGQVQQAILAHEGVCCVYDLHLWSIASGQEALSAHVVVPDGFPGQKELLRALVEDLQHDFGIQHTTIQLEESHEMKDLRADVACRVESAGVACALPTAYGREREGASPDRHRERGLPRID